METFGRWFEDFSVNEKIIHTKTKKITDKDSREFCFITENHHPLHTNEAYAKNTQHGKRVVAGTHVLSLAVGLTVADISGKAIANLNYTDVEHQYPTYINDVISVETTIISKRDSKTKNDRGIILVKTNAFNQKNQKILTFTRKILIPKKEI